MNEFHFGNCKQACIIIVIIIIIVAVVVIVVIVVKLILNLLRLGTEVKLLLNQLLCVLYLTGQDRDRSWGHWSDTVHGPY